LKKIWIWFIYLAAVFVLAFVLDLLGVPGSIAGPVAGVAIVVILLYRANNRPVTNVSPADRDRLLAQGPPANCGLVYIHRGLKIGGFAVGFNVKLDSADVALLKAGRFTRLVVAPGYHQLVVGLKKQPAGIVANQQTAEGGFTMAAGETAVFDLKFGAGAVLRKLELVREPDGAAGLAKLAQVTMVASEQQDALAQPTVAMQASSSS
jgi:hypothetical protein